MPKITNGIGKVSQALLSPNTTANLCPMNQKGNQLRTENRTISIQPTVCQWNAGHLQASPLDPDLIPRIQALVTCTVASCSVLHLVSCSEDAKEPMHTPSCQERLLLLCRILQNEMQFKQTPTRLIIQTLCDTPVKDELTSSHSRI